MIRRQCDEVSERREGALVVVFGSPFDGSGGGDFILPSRRRVGALAMPPLIGVALNSRPRVALLALNEGRSNSTPGVASGEAHAIGGLLSAFQPQSAAVPNWV